MVFEKIFSHFLDNQLSEAVRTILKALIVICISFIPSLHTQNKVLFYFHVIKLLRERRFLYFCIFLMKLEPLSGESRLWDRKNTYNKLPSQPFLIDCWEPRDFSKYHCTSAAVLLIAYYWRVGCQTYCDVCCCYFQCFALVHFHFLASTRASLLLFINLDFLLLYSFLFCFFLLDAKSIAAIKRSFAIFSTHQFSVY